jgi:hypothetical protein
MAVKGKLNKAVANYNQAVSRTDPRTETPAQEASFDTQRKEIESLQAKAGQALTIALVSVGVEIAVSVGEVVYLTRPNVRRVFKKLEN